ncbi:TNF receptor-associated factor 3-like isoform X2 [Hydra vulgaris]|uniref:TNF receptor-associated factor 3-like isoform X2 n=1 Tax=Hydra vulgaris TaxID=6087 RepID=A0ABM4CEE6_HYDVU
MELKRFVVVIKEEKNALLNAYDFLNYIYKEELQETYPNLVIALRIIITLPVTVASAERSFSKLKLIKTFLSKRKKMASLNEENFGGYDANFIDELLNEHECPVCKMALREPIQTQCGHRLCLSCAEEMRKRNKGVLICPLDNSILDSSKIFPDLAIERVIMQLKVKCRNFSNGCGWTKELKRLNEHLGSCEYQTLKCLNKPCSSLLLLKDLKEHTEKRCIYRLVTCQYCKQKIIFSEKQIHEKNCECSPLCCVNQCGIKVMREEMSSHITDSCANTIFPCQYFNIGCKFMGMRKEHETHANSSMQNHLSMAISKLDALENKIMLTLRLENKIDALEKKIALTAVALENKITPKVESLEAEIASKAEVLENKITLTVVALEKKVSSKVESLETKIASKVVALENKITSKVESFEDKNASEVVALKTKITSTVDALKNELISKVDAQKDEIMMHEKNLEIIKAFLAVKMQEFVPFHTFYDTQAWHASPLHHSPCSYDFRCTTAVIESLLSSRRLNQRSGFLKDLLSRHGRGSHVHLGSLFSLYREMQKKLID